MLKISRLNLILTTKNKNLLTLLSKKRKKEDLNYGARIKRATRKLIYRGKTVRLLSSLVEFLPSES